jgi:hypothetical protein
MKPNDLVFLTSTKSSDVDKVRAEFIPVAHRDLVAGPTGGSGLVWRCRKAFQLSRERRAIDSQRIHMHCDCMKGWDHITHTRHAQADQVICDGYARVIDLRVDTRLELQNQARVSGVNDSHEFAGPPSRDRECLQTPHSTSGRPGHPPDIPD